MARQTQFVITGCALLVCGIAATQVPGPARYLGTALLVVALIVFIASTQVGRSRDRR